MRVPRNAPCPCGSGRKYKRCCARGRRLPEQRERMVRRTQPGRPHASLPVGRLGDIGVVRRAWAGIAARLIAPLIVVVMTAFAFANAAPDTLVFDDKIFVPEVTHCTLSSLFQSVPWASEGCGRPLFRPLSMATICLEARLLGLLALARAREPLGWGMLLTALIAVTDLVVVLRDRRSRDTAPASRRGMDVA